MTEPVFEELEPRGGERHTVSDGTVVGRENCEVVLDDPEVSRQHAAFRLSDAGLAVEDLGSSNGTFVNDRQIASPTVLAAGDTVRFGTTLWRLESAPAPGTVIRAHAPETAVRPDEPPPPTPSERPPAPPPEPEPPAPPPREPEPPTPPPREPVAAASRPAAAAPLAGSHGDVPAPPDPAMSAVHSMPGPAPASPPAFEASGVRSGRGSAARSDVATGVSFAVILATAIALVIYFGARDESDDDQGNGGTPPAAQTRPAE